MKAEVLAGNLRAALRCGRPRCPCQKPGPEGMTHCPAHADDAPSLSVSVRDGRVLIRCHAGCPQDTVVEVLRRRELWPAGRTPAEPVRHTRYELRDADGTLVAVHVREDLPSGRKRMWWQRPDGARGLNGLRPTDLLFGLERLRGHPGEPVVLVEGEKSATALHQLEVLAVGTVCGAAATPSEKALRHLVGRAVILWPDADEPGRRHMQRIAEALHRLGHRDIKLVEPPEGVKPGWDAADAVAEGRDVRAILSGARLVKLAGDGPALLSAAEVLRAADSPEPDWVVEGLIPAGGVALLVGRPKSGKSTLARALAVAVAQGRPFLGRNVRRGPVLLVSLEDRKRDAARHMRALGLKPEDPLLFATELARHEQLRAWVGAHRPVLVIIDTVGRVLRLRDSSEYAEVVGALDGLLRLARESGAAILLLHHAPKGSDGRDPVDAPLGSTAFAGTADAVLHLKRGQDGTRTLGTVQRVGEDLEESLVTIGADGWPVLGRTRREAQAAALGELLLDALRARGEATTKELLGAVEGEWRVKLRALQALVEAGKVVREGSGKRGDPYRYCLPEDSLLRCAVYPAQRNNESENRLEPAPVLAESVARDSAETPGVPQRIGVFRATNPAPPPAPAGDGLGDADYEAIERAALQGEGAEPEWEEGWL